MKNIILFLIFLNFVTACAMEFPIDDQSPRFKQLVHYGTMFKNKDSKAAAFRIQKETTATQQQKVNALALLYSAAYKGDSQALYIIGTELWLGKKLLQDTLLAGEIFQALTRHNFSKASTTHALWLLHQPSRTPAKTQEIKKLLLHGLKNQEPNSLKKSIQDTPDIAEEKNIALGKELVALYLKLLQEILDDSKTKKNASTDTKKTLENLFETLEQLEPTAHFEALLQCADFMHCNTISIDNLTVESLCTKAFPLLYTSPRTLSARLKKLGIKKLCLLLEVIDPHLTQSFNNKNINFIAGLLALRFMLINEPTEDLVEPIKKYIARKKRLNQQFTKDERPYFEVLAYSQLLQLQCMHDVSIAQHIQEILNSSKDNATLGYTSLPLAQDFLPFYQRKFLPKTAAANTFNHCLLQASALDPKSCLAAYQEFYQRYINKSCEPIMGLSLAYTYLLLAMDLDPLALQMLGNFYVRHPDLEKLDILGIKHCALESRDTFNYIGNYVHYHWLNQNNAQALKNFLQEIDPSNISIKNITANGPNRHCCCKILACYAYSAMTIFEHSGNEADLQLAMRFFLPLLSTVEMRMDDHGLYLVIFSCKKIVERSSLEKAQQALKLIHLRIAQKPFLVLEIQKTALIFDILMKSREESIKKAMLQSNQQLS